MYVYVMVLRFWCDTEYFIECRDICMCIHELGLDFISKFQVIYDLLNLLK